MPTKQTIAELLIEIGMDSETALRESRKLKKELRSVADRMSDVDEEAADAEKSIERMGKASGVAGGLARGLLTVMTGVAGVMAVVGKEVLGTGITFEKLNTQLVSVAGSTEAANKAFKFIKEFTQTAPFALQEVKEAFIKLKNRGIEPSLEALTSLGNFASATGNKLNNLVESTAQATIFQFERLRSLGFVIKQEGEEVELSFRGVTKTVTKDADKIREAIFAFSDENFGGAMEAQAETAGGSLVKLQDTFVLFLNEVANLGPLEELKGLIADLRDGMGDQKGLAKIIARTLTNAIRTLRRMLSGDLAPALERMAKTVEFVVENFDKLVGLFVAAKTAQSFANIAQGFQAMGLAATGALGPIGAIAAALFALIPLAAAAGTAIGNALKPELHTEGLGKLSIKDSGRLKQAQNRLAANKKLKAEGKGVAGITAPAITADEKEVKRLTEKAARVAEAERKFNEGAGERQKKSGREKKNERNRELASFLGIDLGTVPQGAEAVDYFTGLEVIEKGGSVEDAIAAIGDAQAAAIPGQKRKGKKKKKKKKVTSPTTVSEFFAAAARGELGPIADKTPSTSEIEPTVAIDITNNNFSFQDTFHIRGVGDPKGVASEVISQIKAEFDRRISTAGQQMQTNLVR